MSPKMRPLQSPTLTSLTTSWNFWPALRFSSIKTRMVTARDCVPTLPDMSRMSDWNAMMSVSWATTRSKTPTTLETMTPSASRTSSHGRRFCMLSRSVSWRSSSAVRPASLA